MSHEATRPRRLLVLIVALTLSVPTAVLVPGPASANHQTDPCGANPLLITDVDIDPGSDVHDDTVITPENAAFVHGGDRLSFQLTVKNIVDTSCVTYEDQRSDEVGLEVQYLVDDDETPEATQTHSPNSFCDGMTFTPGDPCTDSVPLPFGHNDRRVDGSVTGEQRIRLIVYDLDDDGTRQDLAGAERVLVVGEKPDLNPTDIAWDSPSEDQAHTTYSSGPSVFAVTVANQGAYPNWNPNGGNQYAEGPSYDSPNDNDDAPERGFDPSTRDERGFPCLFPGADVDHVTGSDDGNDDPRDDDDGDGDPLDPGEPACNYKRGQILDMPIAWETTETTPTGSTSTVDSGVDESEVYSDETSDLNDKDSADVIADGASKTALVDGPNREDLAGTFGYEVRLDADPSVQRSSWTPEANEDNNDRSRPIDILGVDLKLVEHGISVPGEGTCTQNNKCQANATIRVDPSFENIGDQLSGDADNEVRDRRWNATVTLQIGSGPEEVKAVHEHKTEAGEMAIPQVGDKDSVFDAAVQFPSDKLGGEHLVRIRLDHKLAYEDEDLISPTEGRVAERTENQDCPTDEDGDGNTIEHADNTFCLKLHFTDNTKPTVSDQVILQHNVSDDEVPEIHEGENVTFQAKVKDNSLDTVEAIFEHPDGNETVRQMHRNRSADAPPNRWEVNHSIEGHLGDHVFRVHATDTGDNQDNASREFIVEELPKRIITGVGSDTLNGVSAPSGDDAPTYRGTASEPENVFNRTVNITGTGQDEDPTGKTVIVHATNGTAMTELAMDSMVVCKLHDPTGRSQPTTGFGTECTDNTDPTREPGAETWTWWYVDTTKDRWDDPDTPWENLPWVGTFNLTVQVNDTFNRTNSTDWTVKLADKINDNGVKNPNVTDIQVGPKELDAGDIVTASAHAKDVLRVENVFLDVQHESGGAWKANLTAAQIDEGETRNGTYTGSFLAGADGEAFARAGSYDVALVADDFGNHPNETSLGTFTVNDTNDPVIDTFVTDPGEAQEVGGNITWIARITDETEIEPPELTITKPSSATETTTLTFNETTERWTFEAETTPADAGTWSYELRVADYAGHVVTESGQIDVEPNLPPRATEWKPETQGPDGVIYANATPRISAQVRDTQGVERSSIEMSVNGETVFEDGSGAAQLTEIPNVCPDCYKLTYTPSDPFDAGEVVTVEVRATDLSEDKKTSELHTHQFKVDTTAPSATIDLTPSLSSGNQRVIGATSDINVTTTDTGAGPGPLRVTVEHLTGTTAAARQVQVFDDGEASFRLTEWDKAFRGHGDYRIIAEPTDTVGNDGDSVTRRVLYDQAPPKIFLVPELNQPRSFVSANVTDTSRVKDVVVKFSANDGPERELALELKGDAWKGRIVNPETGEAYPENTTVEFYVEATDFFGNVASTNATTFEAGNAVPTISIDQPSAGEELQGTVDVRWSANDPETAASELKISLWYKQDGGQPREIPGASDLDNVGQHQLDTTLLPNGNLELQAIVFDGSTFGSDSVNVTVRNLGSAFNSPEVRGAEVVDGENVVTPGQETLFTVQIDGNVRSAWANVTRGGDVVRSYSLEDTGGGTWQASITAPDEPGEYAIDLAAVTADGPQRTSNAYAFTVQSGEDGKSFVPEWTILSVLFAGAVAVGAFGLTRRWT